MDQARGGSAGLSSRGCQSPGYGKIPSPAWKAWGNPQREQIALVGFPVENKEELEDAREEGVDFIFL